MSTLKLTARGSWEQFVFPLQNMLPFITNGALWGTNSPRSCTGSFPEALRAQIFRAYDLGVLNYVVYSYSTPIAYCIAGRWYVPDVSFSATTAKHRDKIKVALSSLGAV